MSYPVFSPTNGIVSQALTWKRGLEQLGHTVTLINMFDKNEWQSFDAIHFFGFSVYMTEFIRVLHKVNPNIAVSPILDPDYPVWQLKIYANWGCSKLRLTNPFYSLHQVKDLVKWFFVRSDFEQEYMVKGFGIDRSKCPIVPLAFDFHPTEVNISSKKPFCLHISLLCDARKNVKRLIDASIKYGFNLKLGGKLRNKKEEELLKSWIGDNPNIEYVGYLTEEEKIILYKKAQVFALPSLNEGVGIVGLEAAAYGCDIVLTHLGGPQYYYNGKAYLVNPYDVDSIGNAIVSVLHGSTKQPDLSNYIAENYNIIHVSKLLEKAYKS